MNLSTLRNPSALFQRTLRAGLDRTPTWHTPHKWADDQGMYATEDEAWLYRRLPQKVLRDPAAFRALLRAVAETCPDRQVHLLLHVWEHVPQAAPGTPAALAAFQGEVLASLSPVRAGAIGVQLQGSAARRPGVAGLVLETVDSAADELLGELVPDFAVYDADRASVENALRSHGAVPLSRDGASFLESWYTLGAAIDTSAIEKDDSIRIGNNGAVIEMATAGPLRSSLEPAELPDATLGAAVLSVRGAVTLVSGASEGPEGVLMRTSVIFGRRSERPKAPLSVALRSLSSVTPQPLPLRQLSALHETLPCSPRRLAPNHQRVGVAELAALGFADPGAPGAETGLLLGRGGSTMTRPVFVNPMAGGRRLVALGQPGAGKTFACEALALQARLAGFGVTFVSAGTDAGAALSALAAVPTWQPSQAGDLDPFRWLPTTQALTYAAHLVGSLPHDLTEAEKDAVRVGLGRAARVGAGDLFASLALADSATSVAKLRRALTRDPAARILTSTTAPARLAMPEASRIDLSRLAHAPGLLALASATVVASVASNAQAPHLVVVDDTAHCLTSPAWQDAIRAASANEHVALMVTATSLAQVPQALREGTHRLVFASHDADALSWVGLEGDDPNHTLWLKEAAAVVHSQVVELSAACVYRSPSGVPTGVSVGPWPLRALAAMSRGQATSYVS